MSEPVNLERMPSWSYWRTGIPELLGSDHRLATRALLGSISPRHLRVDLAIEGVPVDPRRFAHHLHGYCVEYMECRIRAVLSLVADTLAGPCTEEELAAVVRFINNQVSLPDILGPHVDNGDR